MYCPVCRAEYRPGFTHCPDCDVDLVSSLPPQSLSGEPNTPLPVWSGDDPVVFGVAMAALKEANIPSRNLSAHDPWDQIAAAHGPGHQIWVRVEDAARARSAIEDALRPSPFVKTKPDRER
jgi:hypothetical protein